MPENILSLIIPTYNERDNIQPLIERLNRTLAGRKYEIIFVDDNSKDGTVDVIANLASQYPVKVVVRKSERGLATAVLHGLKFAQGNIVGVMDADLQHPPEEIPKLLEKLSEGYDVVYGTPEKEQHGFWRDMASRITKLALQSAMGGETARHASAFRVFRTRVRDAFVQYQGAFVSIDVLLTWGTTRFTSTPVRHQPRQAGASNYTLRKLVVHALNMMTGFSVLPLQLTSVIGFAFTLFGIGILIYVVGRYFLDGGSVPGFPFLASVIAIFSGAQLLALGIIGEYLARMHFRLMDRPSYVIRDDAGEWPKSDDRRSNVH